MTQLDIRACHENQEAEFAVMSADEARRLVNSIRSHLNCARAEIERLDRERGWEALGYRSWRECVLAEFPDSQSHIYRQLDAARFEREISPIGEIGLIPEGHLRPLTALPTPDARREAWREANNGAEPVTAKKVAEAVKRVGTEPLLERLPEAERSVVTRMAFQPGIPLPLAQKMVEKITEAEPEQRREVIALYQSEDVRDRNKAMTWAADRVTPADPRLVTYRECIRELKRTVREFPEDKEVPLIQRAISLIEEAVGSIKGGMNGTVDD